MTNIQPTQEQIREFWEWCGFEYLPKGSRDKFHRLDAICYPDDKTWHSDVPPMDLNNLFKYAVPKIKVTLEAPFFDQALHGWLTEVLNGEDPALALFWAIWEVKEALK